eukprot:1156299-Pelagomonas_calceolata.AAC.1
MLYADDLTLLSNEAGALQTMSCRLDTYARKKHLIINTVQSEVVHFNSKENNFPVFMIGSDTLAHKDSKLPLTGKAYLIPAAMYGSQVWGTGFVKQGTEFENELQVRHLGFLKRTLGVKRTSNWGVLRECGHEPLQFYWFRSVVKLYDSMLGCNSTTLKKVFQADCNMHSRASGCWTSQMLDGFQGLQKCDEYVQAVWSSAPVKIQGLTDDLRLRLCDMWNTAANNAASIPRNSVSLYQSYFGVPFGSNWHAPVRTPRYMPLNLSGHVLRYVSRFRLRAHTLRVDRAI